MSRIILVSINLRESGSFDRVVLTDTATYYRHDTLSTYGAPFLTEHETSESFRAAMGVYATEAAQQYLAGHHNYPNLGSHGYRLAYVDPACALYVYEIDFDSATVEQS